MKSKTQENWVVEMLLHNGKVSRNEALNNFISRLGAIICDLKKDGWTIEAKWEKSPYGKDYLYYLPHGVEQPMGIRKFYVMGQEVASKIEKI